MLAEGLCQDLPRSLCPPSVSALSTGLTWESTWDDDEHEGSTQGFMLVGGQHDLLLTTQVTALKRLYRVGLLGRSTGIPPRRSCFGSGDLDAEAPTIEPDGTRRHTGRHERRIA